WHGQARRVENPDVASHGFEQPRRFERQEPTVGALAKRAVEHQEPRSVRGRRLDCQAMVGRCLEQLAVERREGLFQLKHVALPWCRAEAATAAACDSRWL